MLLGSPQWTHLLVLVATSAPGHLRLCPACQCADWHRGEQYLVTPHPPQWSVLEMPHWTHVEIMFDFTIDAPRHNRGTRGGVCSGGPWGSPRTPPDGAGSCRSPWQLIQSEPGHRDVDLANKCRDSFN